MYNLKHVKEVFNKHVDELGFKYDFDYLSGKYSRDNIKLLSCEKGKFKGQVSNKYEFKVSDDYDDEIYTSVVINDKNKIIDARCECWRFNSSYYCPHVYSSIKYYADIIFNEPFDLNKFSLSFINKYSKNNKNIIKDKVNLNIDFIIDENYYVYLKPKMGITKMYLYNKKQKDFKHNIDDGTLEFGKEFIYDYKKHYFSNDDRYLLDYINTYIDLSGRYSEYIDSEKFSALVDELLRLNKTFTINDHLINGVSNDFPIKTDISLLDENNYKLTFNNNGGWHIFNRKYMYIDGILYKLNTNSYKLIKDIFNDHITELIVPKDKLKEFSNGILPYIKSNIEVSEDIKSEITIINEPDVSLYFDINKDNVICKIKLKYSDEIDYFDKSNILRDVNYENEVLSNLLSYGFVIDKKKIIMSDLENIVNFIENGLSELNEKYSIYTSENFKKLSVKKPTISSNFSIGKDNIFKYDFNIDGINEEEVVNILKSIKNNKKYYKLSNNNIINLNDEDLLELNELVNDMDISDEDIINGNGELLKYRAIYLSMIKDSKYHIVNTNNLFNEFIDNFYKYKDINIEFSKEDNSILRDYQVTGVKWLYNIDKLGFGGIIADEMGLGKTIQVIYYIKEILKEDINSKFLIVVPTSLVYNWNNEFNKFAPNINKCILSGNKINRLKLLDNFDSNVYITSYGLVREDFDNYINKEFHAIILDEAQNIKNPFAGITTSLKALKANTKLALTGTPIENSTIELWSIFDFIMPGYLSKYDKFHSKYKVNDFDEKTEMLISGLSKQITPFILRRRKSDVVKELPSKIEDNILIELEDEQKKIYLAELKRVKEEMDKIMEDGGMSKARFMILQLLTKLRQICIDPRLVYEGYNGVSNKIDRLKSVVEEVTNNGHKVLIFTSFRKALNIVEKELNDMGINTLTIDGSVSSLERIKRVDKFNNDEEYKVFLIMLKSGGTGLNLMSADTVIHLDLWWNPQAENQATDRAHRIGQTKTVNVIKLVTKGTIEEKVLELQEKKKKLSDKLIDGSSKDKNVLSELTEKDIKELLTYENK